MKKSLVDNWDQDQALILGLGARAAPFQAIMSKPPNVRYAYPMRSKREQVGLNGALCSKDVLAVFNIESDRPDDLLYDLVYLNKLRAAI